MVSALDGATAQSAKATTTRIRLPLDGTWQFRMERRHPADRAPDQDWRSIQVPGAWQSQFDDLRETSGIGVYRRRLDIPADWSAPRAVLQFGAVNYFAEIFLDGTLVGTHEGGYLPFEVELVGMRAGASHELTVRATLPIADSDLYPDFPLTEIPHGKQSWYGPMGGIWQSVWLEGRGTVALAPPRIRADLATGDVAVTIGLDGAAPTGARIHARVVGPDGGEAATVEAATGAELRLHVATPRAWSLDDPALYRLELELRDAQGTVLDRTGDHAFGFRTIEARNGLLYLNGEPIYMRGALDQDYYPDTIFTPPSTEFLEDQFRKSKAMGLNCLRIHIKVPDPRYHEVADRLGMLVWAELPNFERLTPASKRRARETLEGIVARDGNHPSIIAWTIINEDWGTDIDLDPDHRAWVKEMYDWMKQVDPTRLIVDNSPCFPNFHVKSDLNDFHYYRAIPEHRDEWDDLTRQFAGRAAWTTTPYGDSAMTGREPLIVSEFGNWGLPHPSDLLDADGREPWWFETGHDRGDTVTYPHGMETRFRYWSLDRVFGTLDEFVLAAQGQQFRALKYELESMRSYPQIAGYVITELTDAHWEANGLMDMKRNVREFHEDFARVNADTVIIPVLGRWAYWAGETVTVGLKLAHGAGAPIKGARLVWSFAGATGTVPVPDAEAGSVVDLPGLALTAPTGGASARHRLDLRVEAADGRVLASNFAEVTVYAKHGPVANVAVWSPQDGLRERLAALGYRITGTASEADVVVTDMLDEAMIQTVHGGARVLVLADRMGAIPNRTGFPSSADARFPALGMTPRDGTIWRGDWVGCFSWLKRAGAFTAVPGGPLFDHAFDRVAPDHLLLGFSPMDYAASVHSALIVGWAQKPGAIVGDRFFGTGSAVLSTFRLLRDAPDADPTASVLMHALVAHAAGVK